MKRNGSTLFLALLVLVVGVVVPGLADADMALRGKGPSDFPPTPWTDLPPLQAASGVTALAGQVLTTDGRPLPNVTLEMGDGLEGHELPTTVTDESGRFLLTGLEATWGQLRIDGGTADRPGQTYGLFEVKVALRDGDTTVLPYTIWMSRIDTQHAVTLASPTTNEQVITTPRLPGLELRIPAGTVVVDRDGHTVSTVGISPVPLDRPPFPLPKDVEVPIYFTVQPGGAYIQQTQETGARGARLIYPNTSHMPPGTSFDFWNYDPEGRGWYVYGRGTVTRDGKQIVPDPGVAIYKFTGAMVASPSLAPAVGPAPGNGPKGKGGDPVDLGTGLFVLDQVDMVLPDVVPITLKRTYRQNDTRSRPFGIGTSHPYELWLLGDVNPWTYADLLLPDGSRIHYTRISPGTSFTDAVYEHSATPTEFYGSRIEWDMSMFGWRLTLKDGTVYGFGNVAPLQWISDRYGNKIVLDRGGTEVGNIQKITSSSGRFIQLSYDAYNRITQAVDHAGRVVSYTYDAAGRLWKVTDMAGGVTEYTYDTSHRMLTLKDARGIVYLTNAYDANGRVNQQTLANGISYQFAYTLDATGNVTQTDLTDPRSAVRQVTFNSSGYTLTDRYAAGQPEEQTTTYAVQAGTNLIQSITDPAGRQTAYGYDTKGNVTSITQLAGTAQAVTTTLMYEPTFQQVANITDPLGHTRTFTYDASGNLTASADPLGHTVQLSYNLRGQPLSITDALNQSTVLTYDITDLKATTDPLGRTTTRLTDGVGRLVSLTDPLENRTVFTWDTVNRLTQTADPLGGLTAFTYDANGNLLGVTDAKAQQTQYTYNPMDLVGTRQDPLTHSDAYTYDHNGNVATFTDRKGQVTTYTYDLLGRRTKATYHDGTSTTYTYDAANRVTQVQEHDATNTVTATITRAFDGLDRLTQEVTPQGQVDYTYDSAGRRTTMTVAGQPALTYTYDNANRLTAITQGTSTVTLTYDDADRRTSVTYPNGNQINYAYNAASELTSLTYKSGTTVIGDVTYTYDAAGNRITVGGSFARTNLPPALTTVSYNANHQQTLFGTNTLTYDLTGNLATVTDGSSTTTYTWNVRNQLTGITAPGVAATFTYDSFGRRTGKAIQGVTTNYVYDGLNPVQEQSGSTVTATLLTGLGIDEVFTRTDGSGTNTLLPDALGSTVALDDGTGALPTQYRYEPFGYATQSGAASTNSYTYTGREDDGTGLYYYRARYYHPRLQRFISEDPLGLGGGDVNLYGYVGQNPILLTDPSGQITLGRGVILGCGLGALSGTIGAKKPVQGPIVGGLVGCALGPLISGVPNGLPGLLVGAYVGGLAGAAGAGAAGGDMRGGAVAGVIGGGLGGLIGGGSGALIGTGVGITINVLASPAVGR